MFKRDSIKKIIEPIIINAYLSQNDDSDLRRNTLDIFSASIESAIKGITFEEWLKQEKQRQIQKTLQNYIGDIHQKVLGTIDGITDLGVGGIVDIESDNLMFVAEIKNKHNTTKGNHKIAIYDDLQAKLASKPHGTIGYYVEILPKNGKNYDKPFTPSDNKTKQQRGGNNNIRVIDGKTFYEKITGNKNALRDLYNLLPQLTVEIMNENFNHHLDWSGLVQNNEFDYIYGKD